MNENREKTKRFQERETNEKEKKWLERERERGVSCFWLSQ